MDERGVSLVEMIAVLLLMGIVSAVVISRFANVDNIELAAQVSSVRNHIRYTQIMAMKSNDTTWGIRFNNSEYWVFKSATSADPTDWKDTIPDDTNNMVYLPGNEDKKITMSDLGSVTIYFDKFGIPYTYSDVAGDIEAAASQTINIGTKSLTVTAETGFVE